MANVQAREGGGHLPDEFPAVGDRAGRAVMFPEHLREDKGLAATGCQLHAYVASAGPPSGPYSSDYAGLVVAEMHNIC